MPYKNILKTTFSLAAIAIIATTLLLGCSEDEREIQARPWNATDSCWEPAQEAGTYNTSSGCDAALAVAKDTNGNYWQFTNLCIPTEYTVESDQAANDMLSAESCTQ